MQIKLVDEKIPFFFLGDPKNLILSLSCTEPGPVELDFDHLPKLLQQKILIALKDNILEADRSFSEIYDSWVRANPPVPKTETQVVHEEQISVEMQMRLQRDAKIREKEDKFKERCSYISGLTFPQLRTTIKQEKDIRLLRGLLLMEENGQQRVLCIRHLQKKIKTIENRMIKEIEEKTNKQVAITKTGKDRLAEKFTVVESEKKTIYLSTKDFVEIGLKK